MINKIKENLKRINNFLKYTRSYFAKKNPLKAFKDGFVSFIKDFLTMGKKQKLVKYRLNYQIGKLRQMEKLIAANNDHVFLKGRKFNEMR